VRRFRCDHCAINQIENKRLSLIPAGIALKRLAGVVFRDLPLFGRALVCAQDSYLQVRNRAERLEPAPDVTGYRCLWQWTSDLHAPKVIPALGRWLMRRALADHPVVLADGGAAPGAQGAAPQLTFIIGHRGMARLPHLLATLRSIVGQQGAAVECVVVEQDVESQLGPHLPAWVHLVHTPPPSADMPYCRSWAFNIGVQHARGDVLVLHDNDMLVPQDYAAWILQRIAQGYEVVNPKRFIFYLSQRHSQAFFAGQAGLLDQPPEVIVQNLEGGGSLAITCEAFARIGGMDESFIGWGGEDNEFWERAQTQRTWPWAGLPLVHLWHAAQAGKHDAGYQTALHYQALSKIEPNERVRHLARRPQGRLEGPFIPDAVQLEYENDS
jgi:hypothetical protein